MLSGFLDSFLLKSTSHTGRYTKIISIKAPCNIREPRFHILSYVMTPPSSLQDAILADLLPFPIAENLRLCIVVAGNDRTYREEKVYKGFDPPYEIL